MDLSLNLKAFVSQRLIPKKEGKGRVAAIEILLNTPLIQDLIFKGRSARDQGSDEALEGARHADLRHGAVRPFEGDHISYEDALRNADSLNDLRLKIKLEGRGAKEKDPRQGWSTWKSSSSDFKLGPGLRRERRFGAFEKSNIGAAHRPFCQNAAPVLDFTTTVAQGQWSPQAPTSIVTCPCKIGPQRRAEARTRWR